MAVRERINRVKIEHWRLSQVPITSSEEIYQGDLLVWDAANKVATKSSSGNYTTSAGSFIGMSETTNPVETLGSRRFLSDQAYAKVNVIQRGLVEVIANESATYYAFDKVIMNNLSPQHVIKGVSNPIGFVDPGWAGLTGKAVTAGTLVKIWLTVPAAYCSA